jgi:hypothetical protein
MNKTLIGAAVVIFAGVLAVVLGNQLSGQAAAIAFGVAIGVIIGVPAGIASAAVMLRRTPTQQDVSQPTQIQEVQLRWEDIPAEILMLTPDQAQALITLLEQPQLPAAPPSTAYHEQAPNPAPPVPPAPPTPGSRSRDISVVGGADLSQSFDE